MIQFILGLIGMKKAMEKKIANNSYSKKPARIPKSFYKKFTIETNLVNGRKVWTIHPRNDRNNTVILYLHGGAYYANISTMHWILIEQLLTAYRATVIVPDYPLAPESTCADAYHFLDSVYTNMIQNYPDKEIVFMGDSSGGGLALGYAAKIKTEATKQPQQIILFSPWLDVSMDNPEMAKFDARDKILSINGLKTAGKRYAGTFDPKDYRVSPIYADFSNLAQISIFIGTNDLFIVDARRLSKILKEKNIAFNYFEYPEMPHVWVLFSMLKETKDVINKIANFL
jgi:acetyl esterase/lipase